MIYSVQAYPEDYIANLPKIVKKLPFFSRALNNRIFFHNNGYCGVDKKAVILHPIKNGLF